MKKLIHVCCSAIGCLMLITPALAQNNSSDVTGIFTHDDDRPNGFTVDRAVETRSGRQILGTYIRNSPFTRLEFSFRKFETVEKSEERVGQPIISALGTETLRLPPSQMPLGMRYKSPEGVSVVRFETSVDRWVLEVDTQYAGTRVAGRTVFHNESLQDDWRIAENLARRVIGRFAAYESTAAPAVRVGSTQVAARRGVRGSIHIKLRDWAIAKGYTLHSNSVTSMASFTVGGRQIILPLASNKIKIGSQWMSAPEVSMLYSGEWYVPSSLLDAID